MEMKGLLTAHKLIINLQPHKKRGLGCRLSLYERFTFHLNINAEVGSDHIIDRWAKDPKIMNEITMSPSIGDHFLTFSIRHLWTNRAKEESSALRRFLWRASGPQMMKGV